MKQNQIWDKKFYNRALAIDLSNEEVWIKKYDNYLAEKKDKTVVDLGCGLGINSYYLHNKKFKFELF